MTDEAKKAFFLDRDGVLIEEVDYISDPEDVKLIPGAAEGVKRIKEAGFLAVIVSNQSGIARGYFTEDDLKKVEARMLELFADEGVKFDGIYYCFHHPKGKVPEYAVECSCRKPKPGMFLAAAKDLAIDVKNSFVIGDKASDLKAGIAAGCAGGMLVRTGHGKDESNSGLPAGFDKEAPDVLSAVNALLEDRCGK